MADLGKDAVALFPVEDVPLILAAVLAVCAGLQKTHATEREDVLSDHVHCRLLRDPQFRNGPWRVHREERVFDPDSGEETCTGRLDFSIEARRAWDFRTCFAIEAKRLHVTFPSGWRCLVDEYVGKQGMMCFVTGRYAGHMQSGAMLGYVFDGDTAKARAGIHDAVRRGAATLRLAPPQQLRPSPVVPGHPVDETRHDLGGRPFTLYHLLVPV